MMMIKWVLKDKNYRSQQKKDFVFGQLFFGGEVLECILFFLYKIKSKNWKKSWRGGEGERETFFLCPLFL